MDNTFVFLQVGNQVEPTILVKSLRKRMPTSRIIQCSDRMTKKIEGVTDLLHFEGDPNNLMTFRLSAFSELKLTETAVYVDTDMIFLRAFDASEVLEDHDAAVCERSFDREGLVNPELVMGGFDFGAVYRGKTFREAHPYIACFTITRDSRFWLESYKRLLEMPKMFHHWFGDQEAIKHLVHSGAFKIKMIPESKFACLPEEPSDEPIALHFKGHRKSWMLRSELLKKDAS